MTIQIAQPDLERFVDEKVKSGSFPSAQAVIEAAIAQMMIDDEPADLDAETLTAIDRAERQIDRGEFVELDEFAEQMRQEYCMLDA